MTAAPVDVDVDVLIVGAGPVGTMLAWQLAAKHSASVALADHLLDSEWPNNYGVWMHEWNALERELGFGLDACLARRWPYADSYFGGEGSGGVPSNQRLRVHKEYGRVDRHALKARAMQKLEALDVTLLRTGVGVSAPAAPQHERGASIISCDDGRRVRAKLVVDASGFNSKLTRRAGSASPGYQIAYGLLAEIDNYPYDDDAMLFMDFRTDYLPAEGTLTTEGRLGAPRTISREEAERFPTFLYAMPMGVCENGRRRVFFEETNLVGRPPMAVDECRARLEARLQHLGITVHSTSEEEKCFIPMGTALPSAHNRILAIGGAAATVHAATGFQLCRGLASSITLARTMATSLDAARADPAAFDASAAAAAAYAALWSKEARLQRDFCVFGGDFLMAQPASSVRGFFTGFFGLADAEWMGFLAGWRGLPHNDAHDVWHRRLMFGVRMWLLVPPAVKLQLALTAVFSGGLVFFRSVLPVLQETTFDEEDAPPTDDLAAALVASGIQPAAEGANVEREVVGARK
ncbi:hypothetical protein KFE25_010107 [Diacronema lutheri]|uniref:lycopene beta-cyclase n=1 Tax=Diacronema lutheri TaxID=2081491 RepID=A0A8J6C9N2_DIALT|nr:hypothetical protein KFE25_010107 [Diacronema lutheri]